MEIHLVLNSGQQSKQKHTHTRTKSKTENCILRDYKEVGCSRLWCKVGQMNILTSVWGVAEGIKIFSLEKMVTKKMKKSYRILWDTRKLKETLFTTSS